MTYFPYFRGKQYELIAIRECAEVFANRRFIPIIEPVKKHMNGLSRTIDELTEADAELVVIANPTVGDFSSSNTKLLALLDEKLEDKKAIIIGILLDERVSLNEVTRLCERYGEDDLALIHKGFEGSRELAQYLQNNNFNPISIFFDKKAGKLYQKRFSASPTKVLLKDSYENRPRNADHPDVEMFSDIHVTYDMEGMDGFGDYLMVGEGYREKGGPAYTVAIHLTYIDKEKDDVMYIRHFKSDSQDTPTDPGGKFGEALNKLIIHLDDPNSNFYNTPSVSEFRDLYDRGHYPGLGYVKKLAMKHHIETFSQYFSE